MTFLNEDNLQMLWDVLVDDALLNNMTEPQKNNVLNVFNNNVTTFNNKEPLNSDLMTMNKKYMVFMMTYIKSLTNTKTNYTSEDLQNERKVRFDEDLNRHQYDFTNAMGKQIPNVPNFKMKAEEEPIKEMAEKIKEMTAQRSYEIQSIRPNISDTNNTANTNNANNFKKITISRNDELNVELNTVSLDDSNIFNKLKKTAYNVELENKVSFLLEEMIKVNKRVDDLRALVVEEIDK